MPCQSESYSLASEEVAIGCEGRKKVGPKLGRWLLPGFLPLLDPRERSADCLMSFISPEGLRLCILAVLAQASSEMFRL